MRHDMQDKNILEEATIRSIFTPYILNPYAIDKFPYVDGKLPMNKSTKVKTFSEALEILKPENLLREIKDVSLYKNNGIICLAFLDKSGFKVPILVFDESDESKIKKQLFNNF